MWNRALSHSGEQFFKKTDSLVFVDERWSCVYKKFRLQKYTDSCGEGLTCGESNAN